MKRTTLTLLCILMACFAQAKSVKERQAEIRELYKNVMHDIELRSEEPHALNKITVKMERNEAAVGIVEYTWELFFQGENDERGEHYNLLFARSRHHYIESMMPDTNEEFLFHPSNSRLLFYFRLDKNNTNGNDDDWHQVTTEERYYYNDDGSFHSRLVKATDDTGAALPHFSFGTDKTAAAAFLKHANIPKTIFKTLSPNNRTC
ncbi:MAG: hypothetical protein KBT12_06115 [Bacteroidales bacterium]|nr:hypothetical protein [Candidatus Physcousia equi]